ncbi:uncharacterized protein LOC117300637 [Asterias rubens]|uniref:uncharacterized protein LOC117300637 n=1 Tax=Asterias rubens TaxID=7604 RepID=UPI0014556F71|nr:uncharacterized protein LOC117300637 [Asterias rubens]XP_033640215.1 uncharacterized protein LOC117300637 [Asterias rubens]
MKGFAIFCLLIASSSAHICLLNPNQRGSLEGLNKEEADVCGYVTEPCGGQDQEKPLIGIRKGSDYTVVFQKNKSHFTTYSNGTSTKGYFEIGFWTKQQCKVLLRIPDTDTPSLYIYEATVTMPDGPVGLPAILQVTYATDNPDAPPKFYQCSDVKLIL